jgi:hypothetical protein
MLQTVEDIYHSGPIELTQHPQNVSDRSVTIEQIPLANPNDANLYCDH